MIVDEWRACLDGPGTSTNGIDDPVCPSIPVNCFRGSSSFLFFLDTFFPFFGTLLFFLFFVAVGGFFCFTGTLFFLFVAFSLHLPFPRLVSGLSRTGVGSSSALVDSGESYKIIVKKII